MVAVDWIRRAHSAPAVPYINSLSRRIVDVLIASILIILLSPVFVLIALIIKDSSPGPILFRQLRYGRGMRSFELLKFRSMRHTANRETTVKQATPDDPRVTKFGRLIRKSSLDELPQLFNVIRGEMSLIGPRPHAIVHDDYYMKHIDDYWLRFAVLPGLTGLAQISGERGATPQVADMQRRIHLDLVYLEKASPMLDCQIFVWTIREVLFSRAAF